MRHLLHRFVVAAAIAVALTRPVFAQNTVTLEGLVKSEAGPIAGAQVTIVNAATQETSRPGAGVGGEADAYAADAGEWDGGG